MRAQHKPDILDCIAHLSNDEVPTPPALASRMLDLLPNEVWSNPGLTWLDPFLKSGVFLREIAKRLIVGLAEWQPDEAQRIDHIYRNMLRGTSITRLTGEMARRTVYCSRDASGSHAVVRFDTPEGNLPFVPAMHVIKAGRCAVCGGPENLERGPDRENHAYSFIHGTYPTKEMAGMKFDVIVGNPPYQLDDGGYGASATPIYQLFVEQALALNPRYVLMITPSRWFAGGKGLDGFRARMLADGRIRHLVDYPKLYDAFPGVKIRGGVSYFLWDRGHRGPATVQTMWDGKPVGPAVTRAMDRFDVFVRRNEAVPILEKVLARKETVLSDRVSSMKPFGLRTFFHGAETATGLKDPVKLYGSQRITWLERVDVPQNQSWIDEWKVLVSRTQGTSAAIERHFLAKPIVAGPGEACTETYVVAGRFDSEEQAGRYATYLRTRFVRFLVSLRKSTQDSAKGVYAFVPDLPTDRGWTDEALYQRYGLTDTEVTFIHSQVSRHTDEVDPEEDYDPGDDK